MRYDVAQDVSLRAIGGMVAGSVGAYRSLVSVHCKHIMSHGEDMQLTLAPTLRKGEKKSGTSIDRSAGRGSLGTVHPIRVPDHPVYTYVYEIEWRVSYRVVPVSLTATVSELCGFLAAYFFFFLLSGHDKPR